MDKYLRHYNCEVRAEQNDDHGTYITGQPIVFGVSTDIGGMFEEVIDEGALDNADLKDVRFLVNHNTNMIPLARSRNNNANSTMQLETVQGGLNIRADLDTENNETARSLYSAVSRGDISGMSFMYTVTRDEWTDLASDYPKRHIKEIGRVFEVSAVTSPAYEQTSIEARADAEALENAKTLLENSKKAEEREKMLSEMTQKIARIKEREK